VQKSESAPTRDAAAKSEPAAAVIVEGESTSKGEGEAKVESEADAGVVNAESPAREGADDLRAKMKEAKTDAERARLRRALAERLAADGNSAGAVAELSAMLSAEHFDPAGFYNVGNALARLGESNMAVEAYRKAIAQRRGNYSRAQHNLGVVLVRLGRWEEALSALQSALRLEGNRYPEASYNLGRLHALRGEAGLAIDAWTRTLAHQPEHVDAAVALARTLAEDGDPEQGLAVLDAFARRFSSRGATAPRAVEVARGEIIAARNVAQLADGGRHASGASRAGASSTSATPSSLLRANSLDQQTYDLLRRARAARDGERHEESAALYRRVIERRGGYFPPANLELGYSLTNLLRDPEAIDALEPVAAKDGPRYPVAFYHLGRLYERTGQLARARDAYARAAALYGDDNPQILLDLSRVREKAGDAGGAAESMEAYVLATARLGGTPEWAREQLARLRQKTAAAAADPQKQ
jgi:tetratricopeptide (TPR) repeat protein